MFTQINSQPENNKSEKKQTVDNKHRPVSSNPNTYSVDTKQNHTNKGKHFCKLLFPVHLLSLSGYRIAENLARILPRRKYRNNQKQGEPF